MAGELMGDLTKNISRHEIACQCGCGFDSMDGETLKAVQASADHFAAMLGRKVVVRIHSGCRCEAHNAAEGGSKASQHVKARAIDFSIKGVDPADVYDHLVAVHANRYGIGKYKTFTHLDTRSGAAARWW